ncbi:GFA family protein [Rheinheimera sp.]|uniref:GFA family protein n=1 Tax=Rheinheimera sp. TaxID=1869214 RepID=UPI00261C9DA6|nr:GFA family protein [Rheinheimera sp.]MCA1930610.1 GFA family protein [Rheinheimera sp.]
MYSGQCLCGAVKIAIYGSIKDIILCHCSLCRKSSGTAYATNGFVSSAEFSVIQGEQLLKAFSLKQGRQRHFCSNCGSPVYSSSAADPSRVRIRLGILDSDITERPISHNFVSSKANWDDLDAELPRYNSHEPGRT